MRTKNNHYFHKLILISSSILILITMLFPSCVNHRDLVYMREKGITDDALKSYYEAKLPDYKLKSKDELYIQITSLDDPSTNILSKFGNLSNSNNIISPYGASLSSFEVDRYGYVLLPLIGEIKVENRSIPEVSAMLQDSLSHILSKPTVTVKLVNRYVSVLGEVQNPGHFSYSQEKLTVFNALGLAGDITDYGDRNNIILARNENGKNMRINIDLTSSEIMGSEYYYLRPNDMVYVKPMRKKYWGMNGFPWPLLLSTISTSILIYTVFGE